MLKLSNYALKQGDLNTLKLLMEKVNDKIHDCKYKITTKIHDRITSNAGSDGLKRRQ